MLDVRPLSQRDPLWKAQLLGADNTLTIGKYGCLLTCLVIVARSYGFDETPLTLNQKMRAASGFQGALVIPSLMPAAVPGMRYVNFVRCRDFPAPITEIDAALPAGKHVIVEIDFSPARGLQNHWVVLYQQKVADYLIRDPWPIPVEGAEVGLMTRYGFGMPPAQAIQSVLWMDGSGQPVQPREPDLPGDVVASFPLYSADGLALRSEPYVSDATLIKRLAVNTRLEALASDADVRAKLGVLNMWLPVRDPAGQKGYAAAWYLSDAPQPPADPAAPSPPFSLPAGMVVRTTQALVALRRSPGVTTANLIKRLPLESELKVIEDEAAARARIGVEGEWIRVMDIQGASGFIAAWFVTEPLSGLTALGAHKKPPAGLSFRPPTGPPVVRTTVEMLALRSAPHISPANLVTRLALGSQLLVQEDPETALAKIGCVGQWLQVQDITGNQGYVAAWYVAP